ncbi:MAG TPA: YCF48-related protein, partial [Myxococcota bacterium]|nr:YCF48-related protein [Myxococcota bacterium]
YEDFLEHDPSFLDRYVEARRSPGHGPPMIKVSVIQNPFLFTVEFANEREGLISGLGGVILRSEDGGKSWSYVETSRKQALFAVDTSADRAVAVGEKGLVQYSSDGGKSWAPPTAGQFPPIFTFMRDLGFATKGRLTGFIVGQDGMVLRSKDAGQTWTQVLPPPERRGPGSKFS